MMVILPVADRGATCAPGLDSRHAFSFGHYYDPQRLGFGALRVLNEDTLAPGAGFPTHRYANMEILIWVADGEIELIGAAGFRSRLSKGDLLRVSAGAGMDYSVMNPSSEQFAHFLQWWIQPDHVNTVPEAGRIESFGTACGGVRLLASRDGRDGSLPLRQDASFYTMTLSPGERVAHRVALSRRAWLQVVRGRVRLDGYVLAPGDAAAMELVTECTFAAVEAADVLLLDLG